MWGAQTLMVTRCLFITGKKRAQRRTQARAALKTKKDDGVDEGFLFTPPPGRSAHHLGRRASQHQNRGPGSFFLFTDGVVTNEKDDRPFGSGWARRAVLCRVSLSKLAVSRPAATVRMGGVSRAIRRIDSSCRRKWAFQSRNGTWPATQDGRKGVRREVGWGSSAWFLVPPAIIIIMYRQY